MAKTTRLTPTERRWINWVIKTLHKNRVGFIDMNSDQRIEFNKSLLILSPKNLRQIPTKGIVIRANPTWKRKKKK